MSYSTDKDVGSEVKVYKYKNGYSFTKPGSLLNNGDFISWTMIIVLSLLILAIPFILINFRNKPKIKQIKIKGVKI